MEKFRFELQVGGELHDAFVDKKPSTMWSPHHTCVCGAIEFHVDKETKCWLHGDAVGWAICNGCGFPLGALWARPLVAEKKAG